MGFDFLSLENLTMTLDGAYLRSADEITSTVSYSPHRDDVHCSNGGVSGGVAPLDTALGRLRHAIAVRAGTAEELATLFVALLRAHGLEARLVRCDASTHSLVSLFCSHQCILAARTYLH